MEWIRGLAQESRFGERDRLGTANLIDFNARLRAIASTKTGELISIARHLSPGDQGLLHEGFVKDDRLPLRIALDQIDVAPHGLTHTHLDALNHISYDGTWYGGWPIGDSGASSISDLAECGLFTRAIHVDIAGARDEPWVDPTRPVSGQDIDKALTIAGVEFKSGDALIIDMGRDRYEATGHEMISQWKTSATDMHPGVGTDGAKWIVDHDVSIVCWDFQDAVHPSEPKFSVHALIWAIGLVLVDNCNFAALRKRLEEVHTVEGALVAFPPALAGASGMLLNPGILI
jgi:kynurenine formamidase